MILVSFYAILDKMEVKMDFGYKSLIAVVLACSAWCKTKSETKSDSIKTDSSMVVKPTANDSVDNFPKTLKLKPITPQNLQGAEADKTRPDIDDEADSLDNEVFQDTSTLERICLSVQNLEYEAMRLIAMSESIEMNAYYDRAAGIWTIGFGNITHPDGSSVKRGDKIENEEQLMYYFRGYFKDKVAPNIEKYLPAWEKLNKQEKLALLDLFWNAGSGKLHTSAKNPRTGRRQTPEPSELANTLNAFAENRSPENLNAVVKAMKAKQFISTRRQGVIPALQKRVAFRIKIFTGEIQLNGEGPTSIDLDEAHLGAHYGAFKASDLQNLNFSADKLKVICDSINNCKYGMNYSDTLRYKQEHPKSFKIKQAGSKVIRKSQRRGGGNSR